MRKKMFYFWQILGEEGFFQPHPLLYLIGLENSMHSPACHSWQYRMKSSPKITREDMTTGGHVSQGRGFINAGRLAQPLVWGKSEDVLIVHGNQQCRMGYIQFSFLCRLKIERHCKLCQSFSNHENVVRNASEYTMCIVVWLWCVNDESIWYNTN